MHAFRFVAVFFLCSALGLPLFAQSRSVLGLKQEISAVDKPAISLKFEQKIQKITLFDRFKKFGGTSLNWFRSEVSPAARRFLPKKFAERFFPLTPEDEKPTLLIDVITCDNGPGLAPFYPDPHRPWWAAFLALEATKGADPKGTVIRREAESFIGKTDFHRRSNEGSLPYACAIGQEWDESKRGCLPLQHPCSLFNGIGRLGQDSFPKFSRNNGQVTIPGPQKLFSGPDYTGLVETDTATGTRSIRFFPQKSYLLQHTQKGVGAQDFAASDTRPHAYRKFWNREPTLPGNPNTFSGWARHVFGTCVLNKNFYPSDSNESVISKQKDPCGLNAMLDSQSGFWRNSEYRPTDFKPTVLLEGHPPEGETAGTYRYYVFDVPVSPFLMESLGSGNYNLYKLQLMRNAFGQKAFWNPLRDPNIAQPNDGVMTKSSGPGAVSSGPPPVPPEVCPAGGIDYRDIVDSTLDTLGPLEAIDPDVIRAPPGAQINWTSFAYEKHVYNPREDGKDGSYFGDLVLGHTLSLDSALHAAFTRFARQVNDGAFPAVGMQTSDPRIMELVANRKMHPVVNTALYLLSRLLEEVQRDDIKFYWGDLSALSPALELYRADSKSIVLDRMLKPFALPKKIIAPAKFEIDDSSYAVQVRWLTPEEREAQSVKGLPNVRAIFPAFVRAGLQHVIYEDSRRAFTPNDNGLREPMPFMSLINDPFRAPAAGAGDEIPTEPSPCCGVYFNCKDGKRCEEKSGYLDKETCEPVLSDLVDREEIVSHESIIQLTTLLAQYYLEETKDVATELRCSLGRAAAGCSPYPEQFCKITPAPGQRPFLCHNNPTVPETCPPGKPDCFPRCPEVMPICCSALHDAQSIRNCLPEFPCIDDRCQMGPKTIPPCEIDGCQEFEKFGTCSADPALSYVSPGPIQGILCDAGSGTTIGSPQGPFGIPNPGGGGTPPRPENFRAPWVSIHDLMVSGEYELALSWAGFLVEPESMIPQQQADLAVPRGPLE